MKITRIIQKCKFLVIPHMCKKKHKIFRMATEREETLPFEMNHLPDYFKEKARRELNETPERRITGLKELKELARDHKVTHEIRFVDDLLVQFLRQRKYDVPIAFKKLVNFVSFMKNHSSMFLNIDIDFFLSHPRRRIFNILPRRCPEGCVIILIELGKWDPEEISFQEFQRMVAMMYIQCLRDPMTQVNGFKVIHDFKDTSLKHVRYCTPANLHRYYHGGIECFPCRHKQLHLVSESPIMRMVWTVVKPFINRKLKQRIFMSSSRKDLLNYFPPSVLPAEYGGLLEEDNYTTEWTKDVNKQQGAFPLQGQTNYY